MDESVSGWFDMIHSQDRDRVVKGLYQAINRGQQQWSDEYQIRKADDTFAHVYNRAYLLHNEYGVPHRMLGSFIDITVLKTAQEELSRNNEQLLRTNADLDNFVYAASHDLKAPITNIEGLVLMLERTLQQPDGTANGQLPTMFELIKHSISRFKQTIKDLAEIVKAQKNLDGEVVEVSLEEVLADVKSNIREAILESNARIEADFTAVPSLQYSRKNLYSILYNLVSNAIKYQAPDRSPVVRLRTDCSEGQPRLTVQDNGLGISRDNLPKLFTMFRRFHTHVDGTGIGLYIVKRIIDNTGGRIEIQSEEGVGTVFSVRFEQPSGGSA